MLKRLLLLFIVSCSSFLTSQNLCKHNKCKTNTIQSITTNPTLDNNLNVTSNQANTGMLSLHFYGAVSEDSCLELTQALFSLDKQAKYQKIDNPALNPVIELHIQSGGGSLMPAFYVCDVIKQLDTPVHTYVDGFVASAASLISVCGEKRFITKYSSMLIHQLKGATSGKFNEIKDEFSNLGVFYAKGL